MKKLYASKTLLKIAGWRMHTPHSTPLDLPLAYGHKLQKPSKEPSVFQSLGTINFVIFY